MTAPTTPRVTDCTARIDNGQVILDGCNDCADVDPCDVVFAEQAYALTWYIAREARREAARNGR